MAQATTSAAPAQRAPATPDPPIRAVAVTVRYDRAVVQHERYRRVRALVAGLTGVLAALILCRMVLTFLPIAPGSRLVDLASRLAVPFVRPLLPASAVAGAVLGLSSFVAIGIYLLLGWALVRLAWHLNRASGHRHSYCERRA